MKSNGLIHRRKVLALAAGMLTLAASGPLWAQASNPIKVGMLLSASGAGSAAGAAATIGAKIATAEINASGGVLGRQIELVSADDQSNPTAGQTEAIRLVTREHIDYMIGPQISGVAVASAPTLNAAGIMWVTTTAASDQLTTKFAPRHFSMLYTAQTNGEVLAEHAKRMGAKRVAIGTDNSLVSLGILSSLKTSIPAQGMTIAAQEQWTFGDTDMTPQMLTLRRSNPDVLILQAPTGRDLGYVLKNLNEIGWNPKIIGGGAFGTLASQAIAISGAEAVKKVYAYTYTAMTSCPKDPLGKTPYAQLLTKLKKAEPANFDKISHFNVASGYDMIYILKYAATGAGSLDGSKMTAWMEQNAGSLKLVYSPVRASKDDHFMFGPESETMGIDVANPREDGTITRADCK